MITDNLSRYLAYVAFRRVPKPYQITVKSIDGADLSPYSAYWEINDDSQYKIAIGRGTTPPKKTDYRLENQIAESACVIDMQGGMATASLAYKNTTSSDITVTEVGLLTHGMYQNWMLARELLENPVTVKAGEVKSFSITLDFNA